ncbi:SDR family oxidoreductase [Flavobacterium gawalongense]|uniref:SDR family oxidoreductase n=1 Tax=Flavobacterium gawalongense TaxID=2594432 RepID=A0A553BI50_9FLAO|nr:SDR family oxidoreductase [Flavobacterium gawalongense]TRX00217.1 SDR family oxidoreductase [Flavobacterium gawalongense]TRX04975.1 SDR family oxidoreductase [Flavobacterium gawalongense]TRX07931.1 SDR family oxidoreductase [Flavobacterium gawalongense]TRX08632.1 SDR family oxidoreductase [Flavobacterium gawalongense]TRX24588.1 SDR family oxidoreductase [Flavobacterium gawalongense]
MILVTGATGNYGKATIDFLLKKGISANSISALVRDVAKAEDLKTKGINLKIGDYDNYASLVEAFKGVDKLLLVSGSDVVNRGKQQENAVKAAKEAGVKHILYTSFERKNDTETSPIAFLAKSHIDTENQIKVSGMTYTILKNNLYLDALPMFFGEQVLTTGIFLPAGDTKSAFALRNDMAEATANILTSQGHENKEYSLSNIENTSIQEIAQDLSEIVGKQINYVSPPQDIYVETLTGAGVPTEYVGMFAGFAEAIKQGEFSTEKTDLENLLGRKPMTAKAFLKEVYTSK